MRWKKQALTGRAAWGVLGSAAGGHVCYYKNETQEPERSFAENCGKFRAGFSYVPGAECQERTVEYKAKAFNRRDR